MNQAGTVTRIEDHGTVVLLWLATPQGGLSPVVFDHRPFRWLLQGENCLPEQLIGRTACYDGQTFRLTEED